MHLFNLKTALCLLAFGLSQTALAIQTQLESLDIHVLPAWRQSLLGLVDVSLDGGDNFHRSGGGLIELELDDPNAEERFLSLCIEIGESIWLNGRYAGYHYSALSDAPDSGLMGADKAALLSELFDEVYPVFGGDIDGQQASELGALALQVSVWEIINEEGPELDPLAGSVIFQNDRAFSSGLSFNGQALETAQAWLTGLDGDSPIRRDLVAISKPGNQDLVVQRPPPEHAPVAAPSPAQLLSVFLLAGVLSSARRRHIGMRQTVDQ